MKRSGNRVRKVTLTGSGKMVKKISDGVKQQSNKSHKDRIRQKRSKGQNGPYGPTDSRAAEVKGNVAVTQ